MAGLAGSNVKFIPGGAGVPKNIIFNAAEFNSLATALKSNYVVLAKNVWALKPAQMRIDRSRLPRYLSIEQYNRFASIVSPYYRKVVRGFGAEKLNLYGIKPSIAYDEAEDNRGTKIPTGARLSEEQYLALPAKYKTAYKKAEFRGTPYYYLTINEKIPNLSKQRSLAQRDRTQASAIRTPTVGIKVAPMGRWVETK